MKKANLLIFILLISSIISIIYLFLPKGETKFLVIQVENREVLRIPLTKLKSGDKYKVKGPLGDSIFEYIEGKGVHMISSPCPDKICIKQGFINKTGESIVCLPNRVIITLER
uniref:NusG domain II-containing protein n=1 Tax=Dictyoglomus thermophilum TaxID=14 RepID=A0A7C3MIU2_DICTH